MTKEERKIIKQLEKSKYGHLLNHSTISFMKQDLKAHNYYNTKVDLSTLNHKKQFGLILNEEELNHYENRLKDYIIAYEENKDKSLDNKEHLDSLNKEQLMFGRVSQLELFFIARLDYLLNYAKFADNSSAMLLFIQKYHNNAFRVLLNDNEPLFPFINDIDPLPHFLYSLYEKDIPTPMPSLPMELNDNLIFTYTLLSDPLLSINKKTKNVQWFDKNKNLHFIRG